MHRLAPYVEDTSKGIGDGDNRYTCTDACRKSARALRWSVLAWSRNQAVMVKGQGMTMGALRVNSKIDSRDWAFERLRVRGE